MELKVLTYNIFQRPYLVKGNEDDYKQERLPFLIEKFQKYDIICLQEAFDLFTHRQFELIQRAHEAGFQYLERARSSGFFESSIVDGGIMILSKYPIINTKYHQFSQMAKADGITTKGVLYCCVEVDTRANNQQLTVNIFLININFRFIQEITIYSKEMFMFLQHILKLIMYTFPQRKLKVVSFFNLMKL